MLMYVPFLFCFVLFSVSTFSLFNGDSPISITVNLNSPIQHPLLGKISLKVEIPTCTAETQYCELIT